MRSMSSWGCEKMLDEINELNKNLERIAISLEIISKRLSGIHECMKK